MSELTDAEILHLASLARVSLDQEELERFKEQLPKIVEFVETLNQVSNQTVEDQTVHIKLETLRPDVVGAETLSIETLQTLAPDFEDNQIGVPPVLGDNEDV